MESFIYPKFIYNESKGLIPSIYLPTDYLKRVPIFFDQRRDEDVIEFKDNILKILKINNDSREINLNWDYKMGLINISLGPSSGLDLYSKGIPKFQEHNLESISGFYTGTIALKYVSELLNSIE